MKRIILMMVIGLMMHFTIEAQEWEGKFVSQVNKDGQRTTLTANINFDGAEYWGTLSSSSTPAFTIEIWGMGSGNYYDFYYVKGNNDVFPTPNAHLFSFSGSKAEVNTSYGEGLINAVKHVDSSPGFKYTGPASKTQSIVSTPPPPPTSSVATTAPPTKSSLSTKEMLRGKWQGEEASLITKYFDYEFFSDGNGRQDRRQFSWSLNDKTLSLTWTKEITKSEYDRIVGMGPVQNKGTFLLVDTGSKQYKVYPQNGMYYQISEPQQMKIEVIDENQLVLSVKNKGGAWVKTRHKKL